MFARTSRQNQNSLSFGVETVYEFESSNTVRIAGGGRKAGLHPRRVQVSTVESGGGEGGGAFARAGHGNVLLPPRLHARDLADQEYCCWFLSGRGVRSKRFCRGGGPTDRMWSSRECFGLGGGRRRGVG